MTPKTVAVTSEEGGYWLPLGAVSTVHSIKFSDGRIWDAINGWRPKPRYRYNWEQNDWEQLK